MCKASLICEAASICKIVSIYEAVSLRDLTSIFQYLPQPKFLTFETASFIETTLIQEA